MLHHRLRAASGGDTLSSLIASLYGAGQQGVLFVPKPIVQGDQVLFQDSAGTTPVTADNDPVGKMLDISGNGHHATQAYGIWRPIYRTDGTLFRVALDGVKDYASFTNTLSTGAVTISAAVKSSSPNERRMFIGSSALGSYEAKIGHTGGYWFARLGSGGASLYHLTTAANTSWHVVTVVRDSGNTASLRVDGVMLASNSLPEAVDLSQIGAASRDNLAQFQFWSGDIGGIVTVSSDTHVAEIEAYLASLVGVTL